MDEKHVKLSVIGFAILLIGLVGVSFAFYNYTRTGSANNIRTGRIYFNAEQGLALNLTNVFPMTSSEAESANLDSVTLGILGDTTYADGEEFVVTLTNVNNTINGKEIPINFIATYTANETNSIGISSDTYWTSRNNKNATIYTLTTTGKVENDKQVLVGYIDNEGNGINGTLTIKAYVDADRIAISDTYYDNGRFHINTSMTNQCVDYLIQIWGQEEYNVDAGETYEAFCNGTGTIGGDPFSEWLENEYFDDEELNGLKSNNIINEYTNGTTAEWVNGRTVFTTTEWNSFQSSGTPISFKIRAESNEGVWVEKPARGTIESCPDCKFIYTTNEILTSWNTGGNTSYVDPSTLSESYLDVVEESGKNYFLGLVINGSNEVTKAYACGVKGDVPFCIEGTLNTNNGGTSKYTENKTLLNGTNLYNNSCTEELDSVTGNGYDYLGCGSWDGTSLSAYDFSYGDVNAGVGEGDGCYVNSFGGAGCFE